MPVVFHIWSRKARAGCCLVFAAGTLAEGRLEPSVTPALTNVAQLRVAGLSAADASQSIQIEGDVWCADPAANQLVLHDASGTEKL